MENMRRKEYTEILEILKYMEEKDKNKIPKELIQIFQENKDDNYEFRINPAKDLKEQPLMEETLALIAMLNLNYWCDTPEEKQKWMKIYSDNEKKHQEELRKKYNPEDIFKNKKVNKEKVEFEETKEEDRKNKELTIAKTEDKENIFKKIFKYIKKALGRQ